MKRNEGFILQSLRARVADNRYDKSKTQHVIYEDRELAQEIPEAAVLLELEKGSSWRIVIPEILLGCIWWSVVQSFPPTVLHSSIVEKKPYGYELLALCYTSPLLIMRLPSVEKFISTPSGLLLSRMCLLLALLGCHATDSVVRLSLSFVGNMFVPLILSRLWLINEPLDRYRKIYLHMFGYLLLLVLRVYWLTVDPLSSSTTANYLAIVTCVASSIYLHCADQPCVPVEEGHDQSCVYRRRNTQGIKKMFSLRSCVVALAFGALLFVTNWLYGESSVVGSLIGRQSSSSTPIPFLEGIEIMLALATGLTIVSSKKNLIGHPVWYIVGVGSGLLFCYHSFVGSCVLGLFSMSLWPYLLELLLYHPSPLILAVGMETYFMLTSASALVTGHDVIPGLSFFLNGRPIVLVLLSVALIVVGVQECWMVTDNPSVTTRLRRRKSSSRSSQVSFFGSVWRRLSTIDEDSTEEISDDDDAFEDEVTTPKEKLKPDLPALKDEEGKRFLNIIQKVTLVLLLATVWGHVTQVSTMPGQPIKANHQQLTITTWLANFGYTTSGNNDLQRSATLLNATGADIIGVVDCDTFYPFFGSYNMAGWLAKTLDMFLYSSSVQSTGLGILSRYHVLNSSHQLLYTNEGIFYTAVTATVNISNHLVEYMFVKPRHHRDHMINCSQLHLQNLSEIVNTSCRSPMVLVHFIFCNYSSFVSDGWKHITDSHNEGWTVHILYKNLIRLNYLNTGELVMSQFIIPEHINEIDTDEVVATSNKQLELYWTKFLDRFYTDTCHKVLKYFTQT